MAEPSKKAPEVDAFLAEIMGKDRQETIRADKCMTCDGEACEFKDDISRTEYTISGLCQSCQNGVFR